jgi:GNAT superfamily N-acetyltransferase
MHTLFSEIKDSGPPKFLVSEYRKQLNSTPDGMWEAFAEVADSWLIESDGQPIGYGLVNSEGWLIQFFVIEHYLAQGTDLLRRFLLQQSISRAIVGTHDPTFLSVAMPLQKRATPHTYLFYDYTGTVAGLNVKQTGSIHLATASDKEKLVDFCHHSVGASKIWLSGYIGSLINKGELFYLENNETVIGTFEVRQRDTYPLVADLGIIVSPAHRHKGIGTYLLARAKQEALQLGKLPICSCECTNTGSMKAILNNGFRSRYQLFQMDF